MIQILARNHKFWSELIKFWLSEPKTFDKKVFISFNNDKVNNIAKGHSVTGEIYECPVEPSISPEDGLDDVFHCENADLTSIPVDNDKNSEKLD